MKTFTRFLLILLFIAFATSVRAVQLEDRWLTDARGYDRAIQLQRESGLPLVIYFYTDWCSYCRALEGQYFRSPPVQQYFKRAVKVRINPEHGSAEQALAVQYGVNGYPGFFVIRKPSSLPVNVNPFRAGGSHLTPAQFASACERGLSSAGLVSTVSVSIKPVELTPSVVITKVTSMPVALTRGGDPLLNSILDKYIHAVGGRDAVARITSRTTKGRIDITGVRSEGRLETYAKAPNLSLTVMKTESIGLLKRGFDGRTAWALSDKKGAPEPSSMELAAMADESNLHREIKLPELYPRMNLSARRTVGGREVHIVEATSRLGTLEKLYFDVVNGLLLRRDTMRATARGQVEVEIYFSDWREVDGVKLPFKTTEKMPGATYIFTLEDVRHNSAIDDDLFRLPAR